MLVRERMTADPVCGHPQMPVTEAQALMRENNIRHLPIVDEAGDLVGLVTQRSLLRALPSDLSGFSQFEISYLLAKVKVATVMVKDVITIDENTAIEEAARVMADRRIGCLPVVREGDLVGIITDNDIFTIMVDLLGARRSGVRVTVLQPDRAGEVARLTTAIAQEEGYLTVCVAYPTAEPGTWATLCKVTNLEPDNLVDVINRLDEVDVQDVREV